jgi:hypothetical protein
VSLGGEKGSVKQRTRKIWIKKKNTRYIYIYNFIFPDTDNRRILLCNYARKELTNFTHDSKGIVWRDKFARGLHIGFQPNRWAPHCISCQKVGTTLDFSLSSGMQRTLGMGEHKTEKCCGRQVVKCAICIRMQQRKLDAQERHSLT